MFHVKKKKTLRIHAVCTITQCTNVTAENDRQ